MIKKITKIVKTLYRKIFWGGGEYLKKELSDCDTVLDLGCGKNSPIQHCNIPFSVGVDVFETYLKESQKKGIHNKYIKEDIRKINLEPKSFDAVIALDVLEHLTEEEGRELIKRMESLAKKKIIVTTPNGYIRQESYDDNPLQEHKSGWAPGELEELGFKVIGLNGWKRLRGERSLIKYRPVRFWQIISDLTQKITYHCPEFAFQLFAIKKLKKNELSKSFNNNFKLEWTTRYN